mmetsp:Transcript_16570/g.16666  ORF Transcript_16570/g.16666 Transcript_16570/m.16666 type:complete len:81 (-) Transcript_16570:258-500(-)
MDELIDAFSYLGELAYEYKYILSLSIAVTVCLMAFPLLLYTGAPRRDKNGNIVDEKKLMAALKEEAKAREPKRPEKPKYS